MARFDTIWKAATGKDLCGAEVRDLADEAFSLYRYSNASHTEAVPREAGYPVYRWDTTEMVWKAVDPLFDGAMWKALRRQGLTDDEMIVLVNAKAYRQVSETRWTAKWNLYGAVPDYVKCESGLVAVSEDEA